MSTLTDSPEYKALTDSLDRLPERGLFCALIALFRSLFALLAAIKSGAIVLPSLPVTEPRLVTKPGTLPKGMDGRDKHDHDDDDAHHDRDGHGMDRRVRRPSVWVGPNGVDGRDEHDHDADCRVRHGAAPERAPAPVQTAGAGVSLRGLFSESHASHAMPPASWGTVDVRCFRNSLGTTPNTCIYFVTVAD